MLLQRERVFIECYRIITDYLPGKDQEEDQEIETLSGQSWLVELGSPLLDQQALEVVMVVAREEQ